MMKLKNLLSLYLLLSILLTLPGRTQPAVPHGQLAASMSANHDGRSHYLAGLRYLPEWEYTHVLGGGQGLTLALALNGSGSAFVSAGGKTSDRLRLDLYRLWLRYTGPRLEVRAGLQKISFGSALLLRPLMWFDRIDPRDPLHLTEGVYGLLARYYFPGNTNFWLWALYGNEATKGWELAATRQGRPEFGGRFQYLLGPGEAGLTLHFRQARPGDLFIKGGSGPVPERRVGLDGKWDIGPGVWFEAAVTERLRVDRPYHWQKMLCAGADYTFAVGNGLHLLGEYFVSDLSGKPTAGGRRSTFAAALADYPLSLLDTITGIVYLDTAGMNWYRFINWQRVYDRWSFYLIAFWNPRQAGLYASESDTRFFSGRGLQVMLVFNH